MYQRISDIYLKIYDILIASEGIQEYCCPVNILRWNYRHQLMPISIGRVVDYNYVHSGPRFR